MYYIPVCLSEVVKDDEQSTEVTDLDDGVDCIDVVIMVLIWDVTFFSFVEIKLVREVEEWVVISVCPEETDIIGDLVLIILYVVIVVGVVIDSSVDCIYVGVLS